MQAINNLLCMVCDKGVRALKRNVIDKRTSACYTIDNLYTSARNDAPAQRRLGAHKLYGIGQLVRFFDDWRDADGLKCGQKMNMPPFFDLLVYKQQTNLGGQFMKGIRKMISLLLTVVLLLNANVGVIAVDISASDGLNLMGFSTASVTQAVKNYFEAREDYLLSKNTVMDWPVVGIVNDEFVHMAQYNTKGVVLQETSYIIESIDCSDTYAQVVAVETIIYTKNGIVDTEEITHELTLYLDDESVPVVAADGYSELCSNFESCSYLAPTMQLLSSTTNAGSALCIIEIAEAEIGIEEGANNDTKYGEWFGLNFNPWCAMFICWCANQANVATSIIPLIAGTDSMLEWFADRDNYYRSAAYGGTYTPQPGDIIFVGDGIDDADHVGFVQKVEDGRVWIIDGNSDDKVNNYSYKLTNSGIVGYGNPSYESVEHTFAEHMSDAENHWQECSACGHVTESEQHTMETSYCCDETHHWQVCAICDFEGMKLVHLLEDTYISDGCNRLYGCETCSYIMRQPNHTMGTVYISDENHHWYECTICGSESEKTLHTAGNTYYFDATYHWKICSDCGAVMWKMEHVLIKNIDGTYKCKMCDCSLFNHGGILNINENAEG